MSPAKLKKGETEIRVVLSTKSGFEKAVNRQRTLDQYSQLLETHIGQHMLDRADPKELMAHLKNTNLAVGSQNILFYAMRKYYRLKGNTEVIKYLRDTLERPQVEVNRNMTFLSPEQVKTLFHHVKDVSRLRLMVALMLHTGIRVSIITQLRVADIDESGRLFIRKVYIGNKAMMNFYTEYLPKNVMESLQEHIKGKKVEDYIFDFGLATGFKEQHAVKNIEVNVTKLGMKAGIPNLHPHILRHTFATAHYQAYKDLIRTRDALGQKSTSSTEIYARYDVKWQKQAKAFLRGDFYG